ncbi:flagellar hook-length control protein FliK [Buchnera aphidicola (Brachycaudus cardui)]|uniref:Flagellar hook-length control protein FliK n=1 Tax=Buchnera aphidicola (Brachycaudus cardui) TaxID=557993 RepID=A0A4D6XT82_9GAMM|nr:flagellar hook-length control protein FliK [Buchnera aphidicola]QCI20236.1 flagellar hook-length control protein FliK [Buchnera aphidicola (Brachycaudus cardui)]
MTQHKNILLDNFYFLKDIKNCKINKNKNQFQNIYIRSPSNSSDACKNITSQEHKLNIINNAYLIKSNHHYNHKKINFNNINQDRCKNIKNKENVISFLNIKHHKNNLFPLKNINKIDTCMRNTYLLKENNKKEVIRTYTEPFFFHSSKNSIEWKKSISQKIHLAIANKENQAEIYLKPESLGAIYIKINMKHDQAVLSFISNNNEVRKFLDEYVPYLRNSLNKSRILLKEVNIYSSIKNYKSILNKNIFNVHQFKKTLNIYKKNIDMIKYQEIDIYV